MSRKGAGVVQGLPDSRHDESPAEVLRLSFDPKTTPNRKLAATLLLDHAAGDAVAGVTGGV